VRTVIHRGLTVCICLKRKREAGDPLLYQFDNLLSRRNESGQGVTENLLHFIAWLSCRDSGVVGSLGRVAVCRKNPDAITSFAREIAIAVATIVLVRVTATDDTY
jgi:hypothetical protein